MKPLRQLWPGLCVDTISPLSTLEMYARALEQETKGILRGEVRHLRSLDQKEDVQYNVVLLVHDTTVKDCCMEIVRIKYNKEEPYPVNFAHPLKKEVHTLSGFSKSLKSIVRDKKITARLNSRICLANERKGEKA